MGNENEKQHYGVYTIREYQAGKEIKSNWLKIGIGFQNKDGSFNLMLNALPLSDATGVAKLHMRLPSEDDAQSVDNTPGENFYEESSEDI